MSDATVGTAPTSRQQAPKPPAALDANRGEYIGSVIGKDEKRAGKEVNKRTGQEFNRKEDNYFISVARTGGRLTFAVSRDVFQSVIGGDVVRVLYELGPSSMDGLYRVYVTTVERLRKGDGSMPVARQVAFRDVSQ